MCPFKTLTYQYFRTWNLQNFPFQQLPTCCPDWQHRVQEHYFCRGLLSTLQQGCHQMHHRVTRTLPETTLHTYMRIGRQEKQARTASSPQPQPRRTHLCCIQRGQQRGTGETPTAGQTGCRARHTAASLALKAGRLQVQISDLEWGVM